MNDDEAKQILLKDLNFSENDVNKLEVLKKSLLEYNSKYNLISKSTEKSIWSRHILDSAQLIKYFSTKYEASLADFGSGAGFPGLIIAIFNKNPKFHVKLYEKSPVKRSFLNFIKEKLDIQFIVAENIYDEVIEANIVVARAFKKIDRIIEISREMIKKPHKIIILKGKNAQSEINNVSLGSNYRYKLERSITDNDSKIIIIDAKK
ncbi:16S rRNA (guanine(527)-N(7))-methyltransferase RsmG [Pelagibacteraceae bacterium]|nr:16S rRNA (guanine(527)-N(7))-methyltransferase RsmG [Pelagibacteraceae bacterium]MDC0366362.1 16S rRNA (guanine(527)-N(7))-methyltransferase RsmG [Pelagibacteraceae bacterium]